jgi:hypothetical protein
MPTHSPLPWRTPQDNWSNILDADGDAVTMLYFQSGDYHKNRELIVRAVNAHESLVRACQLSLAKLDDIAAQCPVVVPSVDEAKGLLRGALEAVAAKA